VTAHTQQSYLTYDQTGRGSIKETYNNLNTEKPIANRKKYYEDVNTTDTSQRKRFLPSDLNKQSLATQVEFHKI
jgi:hypothetical protein